MHVGGATVSHCDLRCYQTGQESLLTTLVRCESWVGYKDQHSIVLLEVGLILSGRSRRIEMSEGLLSLSRKAVWREQNHEIALQGPNFLNSDDSRLVCQSNVDQPCLHRETHPPQLHLTSKHGRHFASNLSSRCTSNDQDHRVARSKFQRPR